MLTSAIFCVICWFMSGQPNEWDRFFIFYVISTLTSLVAQSLGLLIGAAAPQLEVSILTIINIYSLQFIVNMLYIILH